MNCKNVLRLLQRVLTEFTQLFGARRAAIPENFQFFRATFAEHLRDLDASLEFLFSLERTSDSFKKCNEVLRFSQRMLAVCTQILCPRRAKIWKTFCNFFARFRRWSRRQTRAFSDVDALTAWPKALKMSCKLGSARWPSARNFCARGAPKIFKIFPIFSRDLAQSLKCVI